MSSKLQKGSVILQLNIEVTTCKWLRKIRAKNLMARQRALYEWILSNANLWAGHRSLNVGHLGKSFFRPIKERRKNMQQTVYNPQKGRRETINIDFKELDHFNWGPAPNPPGFNALETKV